MSEFSELIKNFDKIREYMRDFYVYGFKTRGDYTAKSARTYDNERRRIESWLSDYVRWENSPRGKRVFLSVNSARVPQNPLYAAWKSKSFTRGDIMLHFFLLDLLCGGKEWAAQPLADEISRRYGIAFDVQAVRAKLREYQLEGVVRVRREKRQSLYSLSPKTLDIPERQALLDAVKFFQEVAPFGFVGSTILDGEDASNDLFYRKHHYIVHTLEDGILMQLLDAMKGRRAVCLENRSRRSGNVSVVLGIPLRILSSVQSGRRYICLYLEKKRRFLNLRLDSITAVLPGEEAPDYEALEALLDRVLPGCWGVSFGESHRNGQLFLKLRIDERREQYILERIRREGRGGELLNLGNGAYLYSIQVYDANEMLSWVKTFTGRILSLECTNAAVTRKFYEDMARMAAMYGEAGE